MSPYRVGMKVMVWCEELKRRVPGVVRFVHHNGGAQVEYDFEGRGPRRIFGRIIREAHTFDNNGAFSCLCSPKPHRILPL